MNIKTLADFKRFLALPGATVQIIQHDNIPMVIRPNVGPDVVLPPKAAMFEPRTVQKLQGNAVQFSNGSWLQFGKASQYRFADDTVTVAMHDPVNERDADPFAKVMVYKLTITEVK